MSHPTSDKEIVQLYERIFQKKLGGKADQYFAFCAGNLLCVATRAENLNLKDLVFKSDKLLCFIRWVNVKSVII